MKNHKPWPSVSAFCALKVALSSPLTFLATPESAHKFCSAMLFGWSHGQCTYIGREISILQCAQALYAVKKNVTTGVDLGRYGNVEPVGMVPVHWCHHHCR